MRTLALLLVLCLTHLQFFSAMYIPNKLKLNKFVDVNIPANKSYFARLGEVKPLPDSFTGDEIAIMNQDKIQQIEDYQKYAESQNEIDKNL